MFKVGTDNSLVKVKLKEEKDAEKRFRLKCKPTFLHTFKHSECEFSVMCVVV